MHQQQARFHVALVSTAVDGEARSGLSQGHLQSARTAALKVVLMTDEGPDYSRVVRSKRSARPAQPTAGRADGFHVVANDVTPEAGEGITQPASPPNRNVGPSSPLDADVLDRRLRADDRASRMVQLVAFVQDRPIPWLHRLTSCPCERAPPVRTPLTSVSLRTSRPGACAPKNHASQRPSPRFLGTARSTPTWNGTCTLAGLPEDGSPALNSRFRAPAGVLDRDHP